MYISTNEAGKKWGISQRRVRLLCAEGKIKGACLIGNSWNIPKNSPKPEDGRSKTINPFSIHYKALNKKNTLSKNSTQTSIKELPRESLKAKKDYRDYVVKRFEEFNNNGKITVAIFCDTFYPIIDGVIHVVDNYAKRLYKMCNIVLFVPEHKGYTVYKDYLVVGVTSIYYKFVNYDLAYPELDARLEYVLKKLKIDLVHSHSPFGMGAYASKLAKKRKVPFVCTFHSQYKQDFYKTTKSMPITNLLLKTVMKVFNKSTESWTMHSMCADTLRSYGYKGRINIFPNATDYEVPSNREELVEFVNQKHNLTNVENVFMFVGRIVKVKNIFFTLDVLKILKTKNIDFKMIFVGEGPDKDELIAKVEQAGLSDNVLITGRVETRDELSGFFFRSKLFLFPSLYDTSSLVQIEAAAHHLPTLFLQDSVTSYTITDNETGWIIPNSVEKYAQKIIELINTPTEIDRVGQNAFERLYIKWDTVVQGVYQRYKYLIDENKRVNQLQNQEIKTVN